MSSATDVRLPACALAGLLCFAIAGTMNHEGSGRVIISSLVAGLVFLVIGRVSLRPWTDPGHGPGTGAAVLIAAGVVGGVVAGLVF